FLGSKFSPVAVSKNGITVLGSSGRPKAGKTAFTFGVVDKIHPIDINTISSRSRIIEDSSCGFIVAYDALSADFNLATYIKRSRGLIVAEHYTADFETAYELDIDYGFHAEYTAERNIRLAYINIPIEEVNTSVVQGFLDSTQSLRCG
ncbi:MAG: hypothetical protein AAF244_04380, partial [Pseudomonadota bacterium]